MAAYAVNLLKASSSQASSSCLGCSGGNLRFESPGSGDGGVRRRSPSWGHRLWSRCKLVGPEVERRFSFVLKTANLGGVVQKGSIVGCVMFDVRRVVELSSVVVAFVSLNNLVG